MLDVIAATTSATSRSPAELGFSLFALVAGALIFLRHDDVRRLWASAWKGYTGQSPRPNPAFNFMGYRAAPVILFAIGVIGLTDYIGQH